MKKLYVKAATDRNALVQNFEALEARSRRFIGWRLNPSLGVAGGFERTGAEEVPATVEYIQALKCGDLLPANKETAEFVGLPWSEEDSVN